jgi:hypothetical protein
VKDSSPLLDAETKTKNYKFTDTVSVVHFMHTHWSVLLPMYVITHVRLWRGNLVESTEYAARLTDSLMSSIDSTTLSSVLFDGGREKTIAIRTSFKNETRSQLDTTR